MKAIRGKCPNCNTLVEVEARYAGMNVRCLVCGKELACPKAGNSPSVTPGLAKPVDQEPQTSTGNLQFTCPYCRTLLETDHKFAGHTVPCGGCGQMVQAPGQRAIYVRPVPQSPRIAQAPAPIFDNDFLDSLGLGIGGPALAQSPDGPRDGIAPRRRHGSRQPGVGFGVTSMVLGILSLVAPLGCGLFGLIVSVLAVVFGCLGMDTEGRGMAVAGLVTGIIALVIFAMLFLVAGFVLVPRLTNNW